MFRATCAVGAGWIHAYAFLKHSMSVVVAAFVTGGKLSCPPCPVRKTSSLIVAVHRLSRCPHTLPPVAQVSSISTHTPNRRHSRTHAHARWTVPTWSCPLGLDACTIDPLPLHLHFYLHLLWPSASLAFSNLFPSLSPGCISCFQLHLAGSGLGL